jgi:hypothetical protein
VKNTEDTNGYKHTLVEDWVLLSIGPSNVEIGQSTSRIDIACI